MSDSNPPVRGLVAGKYELLRLIGRGGMGSVWEGRHATLATRVAIKFVDPEYVDSPDARARFVIEARAAATIRSKYAIQIYDHGVADDGRPYMVMELLQGEPLDRRLERLGRLSLRETARWLGQVCRALQRAHDAGIIHRDLKPENIFLVRSPDDDEEIAKVLDFGIAKFKGLPGEGGVTSSTKTGAVLGTPFYMSPEQARGLRNIDQRTDLWSLGVIAYKCVTGVLPFDGEGVGDLLVKICTAPLPVPSLALPGLPPAFDAWFARALERDPQRRFASANELSEGLAAAAGLTQPRPDAHSGEPALAPLPPPSDDPDVPLHPGSGTSAPFTASPLPARSTRGKWLGITAAALFGGTIGVLAVVKLASTAPSPSAPAGPSPIASVAQADVGVTARPSPVGAKPISTASTNLSPGPAASAPLVPRAATPKPAATPLPARPLPTPPSLPRTPSESFAPPASPGPLPSRSSSSATPVASTLSNLPAPSTRSAAPAYSEPAYPAPPYPAPSHSSAPSPYAAPSTSSAPSGPTTADPGY
jgi:serine/threonine protein kinase